MKRIGSVRIGALILVSCGYLSGQTTGIVTELRASSALPDEGGRYHYGAAQAFDGDPSTAWNEGADGGGIGEFLELRFKDPVRVDSIEIMGGYFDSRYFDKNHRIKTFSVSINDSHEYRQILDFEDEMVPQTYRLRRPVDISMVRFTVLQTFPGLSWDDTAVAEIAFFNGGRRIRLDISTNTEVTVKALSYYEAPEIRWTIPVDGDVAALSIHRNIGNDIVFVDTSWSGTMAFADLSGDPLWVQGSIFGPGGVRSVGDRYVCITGGFCADDCTSGATYVDVVTGMQVLSVSDEASTFADFEVQGGVALYYDDMAPLTAIAVGRERQMLWQSAQWADTGLTAGDGIVAFGSEGVIYATHVEYGNIEWTYSPDSEEYSIPVITRDNAIVTVRYDRQSSIIGLDPRTGKESWKFFVDGMIGDVAAGRQFVGVSVGDSIYDYEIPTGILTENIYDSETTGLGLSGSHAFFFVGDTIVAYALLGREVVWSWAPDAAVVDSLEVTDDTVYYLTSDNRAHALSYRER